MSPAWSDVEAGTELPSQSFPLARVDLAGATFDDCDLARAELDACDLGKANLATSRGVYFDPTKNKAKGARVSIETAAMIATAMGLVVKGFVGGED